MGATRPLDRVSVLRLSKLLLALAVSALFAASAVPPAGAASTTVGYYRVGTLPILSPLCSPDCLVEDLNVGGYTFPPNGERPVHVLISDLGEAPVSYTVCQDLNGDGLCGDPAAGEPAVLGCGREATLEGFHPHVPTTVFVRIVDLGCGGVATEGWILLTTA